MNQSNQANNASNVEAKALLLGLSIGMSVERKTGSGYYPVEIVSFENSRHTNSGDVIRCGFTAHNISGLIDVGKEGITFRFSPD